MYAPVHPNFSTYIKKGCKGVLITRTPYPDVKASCENWLSVYIRNKGATTEFDRLLSLSVIPKHKAATLLIVIGLKTLHAAYYIQIIVNTFVTHPYFSNSTSKVRPIFGFDTIVPSRSNKNSKEVIFSAKGISTAYRRSNALF